MAKLEITKSGNIFIIPSKACKITDFENKDAELKYAVKLCKANHKRFNMDKDLLIECGIYSEELDTANIPDHGFLVDIDGRTYRVFPGEISRFVPSRVLAPMREGKVATLNFTNLQACELVEDEDGKHYIAPVALDLHLEVTPVQTKYEVEGYNFKEFEKMLEVVCQ